MTKVHNLILHYRDNLWKKFGSKVDEGRWDYIINLCEDLINDMMPEFKALGLTSDDDYTVLCCMFEELIASLMYANSAVDDLTERELNAARHAAGIN